MTTSITSKSLLNIGFGLLIALMITIIAIGLTRMVKINDSLNKIVNESNLKVSLTTDMYNSARERALLLYIILLEPDPFERDELAQKYTLYANNYITARTKLYQLELDPEEQLLLKKASIAIPDSTSLQDEVLRYIKQEDFSSARVLLAGKILPAQKKVLLILNEILAYQKIISDKNAQNAHNTYKSAWRLMLTLGVFTLLLGLVIALTVIRITARSEKSQLEAKNTALQTAQTKSDFLANMSHEIRTPLNAIIGMSGILKNTPLTTKQSSFVSTIVTSGESLLAVINDVLDFSKIEAGQMQLEHRKFNLRDCIEDVLQMQASKTTKKKLECATLFHNKVPEKVFGDELRLRQVFLNLVGNAIKFTKRGEVIVEVSCENKTEEAATFVFKIKDTGIGIAEDRVGKLFKSFTQADTSTTRRYGGTGLGLSISQQIINLMGGEITIISTEGLGSIFQFSIEMGYDETNDDYVTADCLVDKCVLIVDDNPTNRLILTEQAKSWKMKSLVASSGQQALDLLAEHNDIAIAIIDMQMPTMDGVTLSELIHQLPHCEQLPLVLLSSVGTIGKAGSHFSAQLSKPVKASTLYNTLQDVLNKNIQPEDLTVAGAVDFELAKKMPLSILLVEDIKVNQQVALMLLDQLGYTADVVDNGQQAVDAVSYNAYDLVLMDIQMPVMDGLTATQEIIRKIKPEQRPYISAMTANALESHRQECMDAGMDSYLSKPIEITKLAKVIKLAFAQAPKTKPSFNSNDDTYEETIVSSVDMLKANAETSDFNNDVFDDTVISKVSFIEKNDDADTFNNEVFDDTVISNVDLFQAKNNTDADAFNDSIFDETVISKVDYHESDANNATDHTVFEAPSISKTDYLDSNDDEADAFNDSIFDETVISDVDFLKANNDASDFNNEVFDDTVISTVSHFKTKDKDNANTFNNSNFEETVVTNIASLGANENVTAFNNEAFEKTVITNAALLEANKKALALKKASAEKANTLNKDGINKSKSIDLSAIKKLQKMMGGSPQAVISVLEAYLKEAPAQVSQIVSLYEKAEWAKLSRAAHGLKSSSLTVGALKLSKMAQQLETQNENDVSEYQIAVLKSEYDNVHTSIQAFLKKQNPAYFNISNG